MLTVGTFGEWLQVQLDERGWSQSELGRRANIAAATLSRLVMGERQLGPDAGLAIARALGIPPDDVFRRAGLLPSLPPAVAEEQEALSIFRQQTQPTRRTILSMLRGLVRRFPPADYDVDAILSALPHLSAEDRMEVSRALKYLELNAHAGEPRIVGGESEQSEREWADTNRD